MWNHVSGVRMERQFASSELINLGDAILRFSTRKSLFLCSTDTMCRCYANTIIIHTSYCLIRVSNIYGRGDI